MAREQVGTAPTRPNDAVTQQYLLAHIADAFSAGRVTSEVIGGGDQDGINTTFTTLGDFEPGTTAVFVNGLRDFPGGGYTEVQPNILEFSYAPLPGDNIVVSYIQQSQG